MSSVVLSYGGVERYYMRSEELRAPQTAYGSEAHDTANIMTTVIIPYHGNQHGLSQLLVALQPQLHPDDDIYIVDMTKDLSGVKLAALYGSTRCYIFVESAPLIDDKEAIQRGIESMKENRQESALIITPRCVITNTFIANMKKALKMCNHCTLVPRHLDILPGHEKMDANFNWYGSSQTKIAEVKTEEEFRELTDQCKLIRNLPEDEGEHSLGVVLNEEIVVLPK